eukprot:5820957-Lingulodinium_polyedra.AAC.1
MSIHVRGNVPEHGGPIQPGRRRDVDSSDICAGHDAPFNPDLGPISRRRIQDCRTTDTRPRRR